MTSNVGFYTLAGILALAVAVLVFRPGGIVDDPDWFSEPAREVVVEDFREPASEELVFDDSDDWLTWEDCPDGFGSLDILFPPGGHRDYETLTVVCGALLVPPEILYRWNDAVGDYLPVAD